MEILCESMKMITTQGRGGGGLTCDSSFCMVKRNFVSLIKGPLGHSKL